MMIEAQLAWSYEEVLRAARDTGLVRGLGIAARIARSRGRSDIADELLELMSFDTLKLANMTVAEAMCAIEAVRSGTVLTTSAPTLAASGKTALAKG